MVNTSESFEDGEIDGIPLFGDVPDEVIKAHMETRQSFKLEGYKLGMSGVHTDSDFMDKRLGLDNHAFTSSGDNDVAIYGEPGKWWRITHHDKKGGFGSYDLFESVSDEEAKRVWDTEKATRSSGTLVHGKSGTYDSIFGTN